MLGNGPDPCAQFMIMVILFWGVYWLGHFFILAILDQVIDNELNLWIGLLSLWGGQARSFLYLDLIGLGNWLYTCQIMGLICTLGMFGPLGRFVPQEVLSPGTFCPCDVLSPGTFCPWDVKSLGTFSSLERFVHGSFCLGTFCLRTFCLGTICMCILYVMQIKVYSECFNSGSYCLKYWQSW